MERNDAVTWFEIPAADLERAIRFYETLLGAKLRREAMGPFEGAIFPYRQPGVGGCVIRGEPFQPGTQGTLVYLNAGPRLDATLARVAAAGGTIDVPKTAVPGSGMGHFAVIVDSEGNRVGLHALQ
jgi:hypothetical protein